MNKRKILPLIMTVFLSTGILSNVIIANESDSIESQSSNLEENKLISVSNLDIENGIGGDLTDELQNIKNLEEGTIVMRFTREGDGIQSLFSVSNNTVGAEHFNLYVSDNEIGYELRQEGEKDVAQSVTESLNEGINTIAFRSQRGTGYTIFLNGEELFTTRVSILEFLSTLNEANSVSIGRTDRSSGNEYNMTGNVDFFEIYSKPLDSEVLKEITGQTNGPELLPTPEGTVKTDPIDIFEPGDLGSPNFRIPAMYTTNEGTLISSIDVRNDGGHDAPGNNIDIAVIRSEDNGVTWQNQQVVLDYPGRSALIDTALLQDPETNRIFLTVTHFPEGYGFRNVKITSGYEEINGERYLVLVGNGQEYTLRENGQVYNSDNELTEYTVDDDRNLFKDGEENGHILTGEGDLIIEGTAFITMIYSDDDGLTWSDPIDLTKDTKEDWMGFFGTAPGKGHVVQNGEYAGRLIFPIYVTNSHKFRSSAVLYSDDHGVTWELGETVTDGLALPDGGEADASNVHLNTGVVETSECQIVEMPNGQLKMFTRNTSTILDSKVRVAVSFDGGETWMDELEDEELAEPYCQMSVINYSQQIDGKDAVLFSNPAGGGRTDGTVRIGLINEVGTYENGEKKYDFEWKYNKLVAPGAFAYSCLSELDNGQIGLFYEGTINQEMSYTTMDINYIKSGDTFEEILAPTITEISSSEGYLSYAQGETANLKITFDQTVSLFGDRDLTLIIDGEEVTGEVININGNEYEISVELPENIEAGQYEIIIKAKENLEVVNVLGDTLNLSQNIETDSIIEIRALGEVDKRLLEELIESYSDLNEENYTVDSWKVYELALNNALNIVENEDVTQNQINEAIENLRDSKNELKESRLIFEYEDVVLGESGKDISEVVDDIIDLDEGTIVMEFDNKGNEDFQALLSFSNNTENEERFYLFIRDNNQIGLERQSISGDTVARASNLTLNDGMNKIAVKIEDGIGYSIFINGVKEASVTNSSLRFLDGIDDINAVNIGFSDRATIGGNPFQGEIKLAQLFAEAKTDEELIRLTGEEDVVVVDKAGLQTVVDSVADLNSEVYTEETWAVVTSALTVANTVLANEEATQEVVNSAKLALEEAIEALVEAPILYGNIGLTLAKEINVGDTTNLKIAINDMEDSYDAYSAEVTVAYDETVFDLGDITSVDDSKYIVTAGDSVDGVIKVLVASMGEPIVSAENLINVELTSKAVAEASPLVVSGNVSDGETYKDIVSSTATVKVNEVEEEVELHTGALELAVEVAEGISEEELEDVVPAVVAEFNEALAEAKALLAKVVAEEAVTQVEINDAFDKLAKAMQMLEHKGDRTELLALIASLDDLVEAEYTVESWTNLQTILNSDLVQDVVTNENSLQADIEKAYTVLFEAFSSLEEREDVDKSKLESMIDRVEALEEEKYIPSTWSNLEEVLASAKVIFNNEAATQEEVNTAYDKLIRAYLELRLSPDKSLLEDLLNEADELKAEDYTVESFNSFELVFESAKAVFENDEASDSEVEDAESKLRAAMDSLVRAEEDNSNEDDDSDKDDSDKDDSDKDDDKLPQTGGTSSVLVGIIASIMATIGALLAKKKK